MFGPVTWWAGPSATPDDLSTCWWRRATASRTTRPAWPSDLDRLVEDLPRPEGLEIVEVERSDGILDDGPRGVAGGQPRDAGLVRREGRAPPRAVRRRRPPAAAVAPLRRAGSTGDPVSASRVLVARRRRDGPRRVDGARGAAPRDRFRGDGRGARRRRATAGCRIGVLQASSMGQGPYRRLGFQYVAPYGRYVRDRRRPSSATSPPGVHPRTRNRRRPEPTGERPSVAEAPLDAPRPTRSIVGHGSTWPRMATSFDIVDALTVVGPVARSSARYGLRVSRISSTSTSASASTRRLTLHAEARDGVPDEGNRDDDAA